MRAKKALSGVRLNRTMLAFLPGSFIRNNNVPFAAKSSLTIVAAGFTTISFHLFSPVNFCAFSIFIAPLQLAKKHFGKGSIAIVFYPTILFKN